MALKFVWDTGKAASNQRKHRVTFETAARVFPRPNEAKGDAMKKPGIAVYELDAKNPPPLTAAQNAELKALAHMPDDQIDFSDIPPASEEFWRDAVRNPFYRPVKQQLTVRLDADVLAWLRSAGRGYQTKLNDILRQAMLGDIGKG